MVWVAGVGQRLVGRIDIIPPCCDQRHSFDISSPLFSSDLSGTYGMSTNNRFLVVAQGLRIGRDRFLYFN